MVNGIMELDVDQLCKLTLLKLSAEHESLSCVNCSFCWAMILLCNENQYFPNECALF